MLDFVEEKTIMTNLARIHGVEDVFGFLNPSEDELNSPYLLENIEDAVHLIADHVIRGCKIVIHIDQDNDGVNSGALTYSYLKNFTDNVSYIHSQREDGHGVEMSENLIDDDTDLLIIIDSSSNSVDACKRISEKGIQIIIIDHHKIDIRNDFCILVNPQSQGCKYPNKNSSASVIAWQVIRVLDDYFSSSLSHNYISMAAIGLIGDVMSLKEDENRYIVSEGLQRKNLCLGILALLDVLKKDSNTVNTTDVSFSISPCLNACARKNKLELAIQLLIETDYQKCLIIAREVVELNEMRKKEQLNYFNDLLPSTMNSIANKDKCIIIVNNEIGKGYRGLVANNFAEEFQRTVFVVSENDDENYYSGSFRTFGDFNVREFLKDVSNLIKIVGHDTVGGAKFLKNDLDRVVQYFNDNIKVDQMESNIEYIMEINLSDLTENLIREVESFYRLSGKGIETGKFKITNLTVIDKKVMGKDKNTIKLSVVPTSDTYFLDEEDILKLEPVVNLMKFRANEDFFLDEFIGKEIECVGELNLNAWKNPRTNKILTTKQIFIEDWKFA